ncbi:MAG TPA: sugar ABC transporter substrate-binding protein [Chloroflexota bacterium]
MALMRPGKPWLRTVACVTMASTLLLVGWFGPGRTWAAAPARSANAGMVFHLPAGTFTLNPRIAARIKNHQPLRAIMSFQALGVPFAYPELTSGMKTAFQQVKKTYGRTMTGKVVGPTQTDPNAQISQIHTLLASGQVDCLGIEPVTPQGFANIFAEAWKDGVPVFSVNTDAPKAKRISYYGLNELAGGKLAGQYTVNFLRSHGVKTLTAAHMETGDTTAPWAQERMAGWESVVKAAWPNVKIDDTPTSAPSDNYAPQAVYSATKAYLTGHPQTQFIFHTDWGGESIGKVIKDLNLMGKVYTLGYNADDGILNEIQSKQIIGTVDQRYDLQSGGYVKGCASMLFANKAPKFNSFVTPYIVTPQNVVAYRNFFHKLIHP